MVQLQVQPWCCSNCSLMTVFKCLALDSPYSQTLHAFVQTCCRRTGQSQSAGLAPRRHWPSRHVCEVACLINGDNQYIIHYAIDDAECRGHSGSQVSQLPACDYRVAAQ
jgi:hypothetical protein